jgi:Ca-activated chloride channel homolog
MRHKLFCIVVGLNACGLLAQKDAKNVYYGNQFYNDGKTVQAMELYRNAIKENSNNPKAYFNLGNALYKNAQDIRASKENLIQGGKKVTPDSLAALVFDEAAQNFAQVANSVSNRDTLHQAWHNIGNCYLQKKDYQQAINAYKKALKHDPKDEDTRYNLAYALKHLPEQQKSGGGGKNNQKEEDKKDEKKNSSPKSDMTKEQAEQLLKALMRDEKKQQDKRKQKQQDPGNTTVDKDW